MSDAGEELEDEVVEESAVVRMWREGSNVGVGCGGGKGVSVSERWGGEGLSICSGGQRRWKVGEGVNGVERSGGPQWLLIRLY